MGEEKVIELVDGSVADLWRHVLDEVLKACNDVCGNRVSGSTVDT